MLIPFTDRLLISIVTSFNLSPLALVFTPTLYFHYLMILLQQARSSAE